VTEWINKLTVEERWFYGAVISAVLVLFSILAKHRLSDARNKKIAIRESVIKYKSSFKFQVANTEGIGHFYMGDMASGFKEHEAAVQEVMPMLPKRYQWKLTRAWYAYAGKHNNHGFSSEEYVQTMWCCVETGQPAHSENIERKFHRLYTCLDGLK
jgi:hypothetical protein